MAGDSYELKGKGKKAQYRLNAIENEIRGINEKLNEIRTNFLKRDVIVREQAFSKIEGIDEKKSEDIWKELKTKGVIDENGKITNEFKPTEKAFELKLKSLEGVEAIHEQDIINILQQENIFILSGGLIRI